MSRESDETGDPAQQDTPYHLDSETDIDPNWNRVREDLKGHTGARAPVLLYRLEIESHKIEQAIRTLQHQSSQHHTTQVLGMRILQALTPRGFTLDEMTPETREL